MLTINGGATQTEVVSSLDKYTEYEFQVLAFTSVGDGPKSSVKVKRTKEDGKTLFWTKNLSIRTNFHLFACYQIGH